MPVVKADAYRHGAVEVSKILEAEGASWLAVSNVEEGIALREAGMLVTTPSEASLRGDVLLLVGPGLAETWPELAARLLVRAPDRINRAHIA